MSGNTNPGFENELNILEAAGRPSEMLRDMKSECVQKSSGYLATLRNGLESFMSRHRKLCKNFGLFLLNFAIILYLVFSSIHWRNNKFEEGCQWCDGYGMLLLILGFTYFGLCYYWVLKPYLGKYVIQYCWQPLDHFTTRTNKTKCYSIITKVAIYGSIFAAIIIFLIIDTIESRDRLISATGFVVILLFGWIFSKHPGNIKWRPIFCGLILQFLFGFLTIRWEVGRDVFQCISKKVATFLDFAKEGGSFIFSEKLVGEKIFAFAVMPVIFYFSFIIQILYYLGVMQWVIMKLGWALQGIMGTTLCESINCAANTFIGMSEAPLLIKPYMNKLTTSELHAIMCSGFATVSGTVLAAYIGFGAEPAHLLTASVMSAPAALCFSKLFYPETEKSLTSFDNIKLEKSEDSSLLDAASKGALAAIPIVLGIIANIIAFVSFVALINALLGWVGLLVGFEDLTFELILSKVFIPLSWIMGVPWEKCEEVATLIGLKTVVNEFVAYKKLGEYKEQQKIYGRTEAIATFAICGFSNPGSVGIMLGVLSSMAPDKKEQIAGTIVRAFVAGSAVCFLTACTAGMLMPDDFIKMSHDTMMEANTTAASRIIS